MVAIINVKLV